MTESLTRRLGEFVSGLEWSSVPAAASEVVTTGFAVCVGVLIAGAGVPNVNAVREVVLAKGGRGKASVLFGADRTDGASAAAINGTAAHILDWDDVALRGHPSAVLVPAILAEAEELDASGEAMAAAYVAGYETWAALGSHIPQPMHLKGWHPTSILGALAAAAACANLRRLDPSTATNALSLAASNASGLAANFGSTAKSLHVGSAASAGVTAARLAAAGATGAGDVLESTRGFLFAFGGEAWSERSVTRGYDWSILKSRLNIKRYPVCYAIHRIVDAISELHSTCRYSSTQIASIRIQIGSVQNTILRVDRPTTALEAKFSARFAAAMAAAHGTITLRDLATAFPMTAETRRLLDCVIIETTDDTDPDMPNYSPFDQAWIILADGRTLESRQVSRALGHASLPLSRAALRDKFDDCTQGRLSPEVRSELFDTLTSLPQLPSAQIIGEIATRIERTTAPREAARQ